MIRRPILFLFCLFCFPVYGNEVGNLPDGFVYLKDVIPDVQLEIRYYSNNNFIGKRIDGYSKPVCIITAEAANALNKVQQDLKQWNMGLKVFDAYRPQRAVNHFQRVPPHSLPELVRKGSETLGLA